jgi:hypothetical protein
MLIKISWLCLLAAVVLFIWAGSCMIDTSSVGQALIVEEPEKDIGQKELGVCTVELLVFNAGDQPYRVIGIVGG